MIVISKIKPFKLSLGYNVIITKTAPDRLYRMFASIAPIADKIVVVADEKTDDKTLKIASGFTVNIYRHPFNNDFAAQRNVALSVTDTDYIGWIDSDEYLSRFDASRINNLMTRPEGKAYFIWQVSPSNNNTTIYVPQVRLFPNRPGITWEIPIHEQILPSLNRMGIKTQMTDLRIEHEGYRDAREVLAKHKRNLRILEKEMRGNPDAFTVQNYQKAIAYERSLRRG